MLTYGLAIRPALILASGLFCCIASSAHAESQYPILDKVAERVVQKYQTSSCEQLAAERSHPKPEKKEEMEERLVRLLQPQHAQRVFRPSRYADCQQALRVRLDPLT